jgi:hypothetical protein
MIKQQEERPAENQEYRAEKERHHYDDPGRVAGMPEAAPLLESEHEDGGQYRVAGNNLNAKHGFTKAQNINSVKH